MSETTPTTAPKSDSAPSALRALQTPPPPGPRLRLWPAVIILAVQWLAMILPAWLAPVTMIHFVGSFAGPFLAAAALCVWWLFASRLPRKDRWLGVAVFAASGAATWLLAHRSMTILG